MSKYVRHVSDIRSSPLCESYRIKSQDLAVKVVDAFIFKDINRLNLLLLTYTLIVLFYEKLCLGLRLRVSLIFNIWTLSFLLFCLFRYFWGWIFLDIFLSLSNIETDKPNDDGKIMPELCQVMVRNIQFMYKF